MNTEAHKRLAAARTRLREAERVHAAACAVCNAAEIAVEIAERELDHAISVSRTNFMLIQSAIPLAMPRAAARDAFAIAKARLTKASSDVRAAEKERGEAQQEIEAARDAFADGGDWRAAAAMWHAEAQQLEQAAREARAEANHADQKHATQNDITHLPIAELNRLSAGGTR